MIITNENSIYIFFEAIEQLEPESVLDVGMFLKRIGNLSRCAMCCQVPDDIRLDGVDFFEEYNLPVWENVYDNITKYDVFFQEGIGRKYDLAVLLGITSLQQKVSVTEMFIKLQVCSRYVLVDDVTLRQLTGANGWNIRELKLEDNIYYLIVFD